MMRLKINVVSHTRNMALTHVSCTYWFFRLILIVYSNQKSIFVPRVFDLYHHKLIIVSYRYIIIIFASACDIYHVTWARLSDIMLHDKFRLTVDSIREIFSTCTLVLIKNVSIKVFKKDISNGGIYITIIRYQKSFRLPRKHFDKSNNFVLFIWGNVFRLPGKVSRCDVIL